MVQLVTDIVISSAVLHNRPRNIKFPRISTVPAPLRYELKLVGLLFDHMGAHFVYQYMILIIHINEDRHIDPIQRIYALKQAVELQNTVICQIGDIIVSIRVF